MLHTSVFIVSYFFTELIFTNSKQFNSELLVQDVSRFTSIEDFNFLYSFVSLLVAATNVILFHILRTNFKNIENKLYLFGSFFTLNLITILFIFYFFRIYTVSRIYLLLSILFFPLILLIISSISKKYYYINYLIIFVLVSMSIYMFVSLKDTEEALEFIPDGEEINQENNRPSDYYPDLEMNLIGGETDVLDYFPSLNTIISDYREYKNEYRGNLSFNQKYELERYSICCYWLQYTRSGGKSVGYLENYKDKLIYLHGSGFVSYTDKSDLLNGNFRFNIIESNFHEIINNKFIYEKDPEFDYGWADWWESTRDLLIVNDKIYVSFVNEKSKDCVNVEILSADFNYEYINFDYFFSNDECVMRTDYPLYNGMVAGGKLVNFNNNEILMSTGDFRNWEKAQDDNSYLGKVIAIKIDSLEYYLIAKGLRNPQGLALTKNKNYLIETEHGPVGGDEINLIEINELQNFGWPISSYGKHWFPENYEMKDGIATLHGSHAEYGMREPLFYQYVGYFGGIGISDVEINHYKDADSFFVTTLNGGQIFDIDVNIEENKMTSFTRYKINDRIRDMEYDPDNEVYYLILENGPSLGIFSKSK